MTAIDKARGNRLMTAEKIAIDIGKQDLGKFANALDCAPFYSLKEITEAKSTKQLKTALAVSRGTFPKRKNFYATPIGATMSTPHKLRH